MTDSPPPIHPPKSFVRVGIRGFTWSLPRRFSGYFADTTKQVLGNAPKYVIRTNNPDKPEYLVKYSQKFGRRETFTEFFINRFGVELGFAMAHSGLVLLDGTLAFISRRFLTGDETLRHGSLMIEDFYKDEKALDRVRRNEEQAFYSIDFVADIVRAFCGKDFDSIFQKFVEMLIFDALIGSMDRHAQNWGVCGPITEPVTYRFAPIFDSARALFWNVEEQRLVEMERDAQSFQAYLLRAKPVLGPERKHDKVNKCNHFEFVKNLLKLYPHQTIDALQKVPERLVEKRASILLRQFPFDRAFSDLRKKMILKVLVTRSSELAKILEEGRGL